MTRQAREQFIATLAMLLTLAAGGALVGGLSGGLLVPVAAVLVMAFAKGRLVILDIDEKSLDKFGQWPWSRIQMAKVIDRLRELGAITIVLDIIYGEADRTGPAAIAPMMEIS